MILRLFHLMKSSTWLFMFGFSFASCIQGHMEDICFLRNHLVVPLIDISWYITGKQKEVDDHGKLIGQKSFKKNFTKAHALFLDLERRLQGYPKITKYSIAQSILEEMHAILNQLKEDIESLPDGLEKNQFRKEWSRLAQYVSSLITKKDV